jgi:hypothetical protein
MIYKHVIRDINNVKCSRETELYRKRSFSMSLSHGAANTKRIFSLVEYYI